MSERPEDQPIPEHESGPTQDYIQEIKDYWEGIPSSPDIGQGAARVPGEIVNTTGPQEPQEGGVEPVNSRWVCGKCGENCESVENRSYHERHSLCPSASAERQTPGEFIQQLREFAKEHGWVIGGGGTANLLRVGFTRPELPKVYDHESDCDCRGCACLGFTNCHYCCSKCPPTEPAPTDHADEMEQVEQEAADLLELQTGYVAPTAASAGEPCDDPGAWNGFHTSACSHGPASNQPLKPLTDEQVRDEQRRVTDTHNPSPEDYMFAGVFLQLAQDQGVVDGLVAELAQEQKWFENALEAGNNIAKQRDEATEELAAQTKVIQGLQERETALTGILKRVVPQPFFCEDCGYFVAGDEDACCVTCGAQLEIVGFDAALRDILATEDAGEN